MKKFDALIFDMDGTLWDAVDSYCRVWNITFAELGIPATVDREALVRCMGMQIGDIFARIVNMPVDAEHFLKILDKNEELLMPVLGGKLYPDVARLIPELAKHYKLYMVSNCGSQGLHNFLRFTGLAPYFTDTLTFGQTQMSKDKNIEILRERHHFTNPIYIGDTQGDCTAAHRAGIPMMLAAYGFGTAPDAEYRADSFAEVANFFISRL